MTVVPVVLFLPHFPYKKAKRERGRSSQSLERERARERSTSETHHNSPRDTHTHTCTRMASGGGPGKLLIGCSARAPRKWLHRREATRQPIGCRRRYVHCVCVCARVCCDVRVPHEGALSLLLSGCFSDFRTCGRFGFAARASQVGAMPRECACVCV